MIALLLVAALVACGAQLDLQSRAAPDPSPAASARSAGLAASAIRRVGSISAARPTTPTAPRRPGPPRILVIGDSLVTLATAPLERRLRADGWQPRVIGANGWRLDQINLLDIALRRTAPDWDAVVVWAGNNDILQHDPWRTDLSNAAQLVAFERCGVLVGISDVYWAQKLGIPKPATPVYNPEAVAFDRTAAKLAAAHRLVFLPWQREIHTTQPWFRWDLIHVTPAGAEHAADLITRAARACKP